MDGILTQNPPGSSVHLSSILRAQYSSSKLALPVDSGVHARLKHVQGIPSPGGGGYSLTKLQMIDLMVERLVQLRGKPVVAPVASNDEEAFQALASLAGELHRALESVHTSRGSFAAGMVEPGLFVNLVA